MSSVDGPASLEDFERICLSLPETELGISWGDRPTFKVPTGPKGRGFALYRAPRHDAVDPETGEEYDDLIVVRCSAADKAALVADERLPFFTIDHFRNFNAVLVQASRLNEISVTELGEILTEAWCVVAPKSLIKARLRDG